MGQSRSSSARKGSAARAATGATVGDGTTSAALALGSPDLRVAALLRERDQLLRKIAAKDRERGRLQQSSEELSRTLRSELPPIFARQQQISTDLKQLFDEIFKRPLSRSALRSVRSVFDSLRRSGFISDELDAELDDADEQAFREAQQRGRERAEHDDRQHQSAGHGGNWAHTERAGHGASAAQSGDALRSNFRRIAALVHPDRVQSDTEKRARTELMKELTHAYEAGDLARLLQLEERWMASEAANGATGEAGPSSGAANIGTWSAERLRGLERVVADLGSQLRALLTEVRSLRRESPLADLTGVRPRSRAHQAELLADFVGRANNELQMAESTLSFVRQFAAGELSLAQFMAGPPSARRRAEPDADDLLDLLMNEMVDFERGAPKRGRRSRG